MRDYNEQDAFRDCSSCGQVAFEPKPCNCCEYERKAIGGAKLVYCSDCRTACTSCGKDTCESHVRKSGECVSCSGPTDAEMLAAGILAELSRRVGGNCD